MTSNNGESMRPSIHASPVLISREVVEPLSSSFSISVSSPEDLDQSLASEYNDKYAFIKDFSAGTLAGIAGTVVGQPFDTVKVMQQMKRTNATSGLAALRDLAKTEGFRGLFKGMSSPLVGVAFLNAVTFTSFSQARDVIMRDRPESDPMTVKDNILCGVYAGLVTSLISSPVELLKIQMQIQPSKRGFGDAVALRGPLDVARRLVKTHGPMGLFKGLPSTMLREAPAVAIYFSTYDWLKNKLSGDNDPSPAIMLLSGGLGGIASWCITYPTDIIKTHIQGDAFVGRYKGYFNCARQIIQKEGVSGLFVGLRMTTARAFPVNGVIFVVYEMLMKIFQ